MSRTTCPYTWTCEWQCIKKLQKISDVRRKRAEAQTDNSQFEWLLPWKSGKSIFHKCHSPLSCFVGTVYFIYFFIYLPPPPSAKLIFVECEISASNSSLFYSFSDFVMVNSQVDVFNFEMNVYCRVSVLFSMLLWTFDIRDIYTAHICMYLLRKTLPIRIFKLWNLLHFR